MSNARMFKSVIKEYGIDWAVNRCLYSIKLEAMGIAPVTEKWYEKKTMYPKRLDLFQIDLDTLRAFLRDELSDGDKEKLIAIADSACEGIITGFSSIEFNYGKPIDWQLNPLTGKRCDEKKKWYKIPDFDEERGDIKVIWEASRFSHFITLARAYLLTGDRKHYEAFSSQLKEWLEKNPYGFGANFKCGQECSLRMINTILAFAVFRECGIATDTDDSNVKDLVDRCYRKVLSNFFYAYKCIKNNHTISELVGMIVGAWCCNDQKQLERGYRLLDEVIAEQFTDDGGYRQFSFNYQRLALQDLECVLSIEGQTGKSLSNQSKKKIQSAAWLMYQCQDESGDMPNYGSNDGALIFPVTSCGYRDFTSVINAVYALITGKQLYSFGKHQEELIWFSSGKKLDKYEVVKADKESFQFVDAGLFTLRDDTSWALIVANDYHSRPAHMDQLHFDLWVDGVNVLCDGGTYSYATEEGKKLVRNESHNTAVVNGVTQMNVRGPFMIYGWTRRELGSCSNGNFEGKSVSMNGYTHRRRVWVKQSCYEITDQVDKDCEMLFHTPCKVDIVDEMAILSMNGKEMCRISSTGDMNIRPSTRSLYYYKKDAISCLMISGQAETEIKTKIIIERN